MSEDKLSLYFLRTLLLFHFHRRILCEKASNIIQSCHFMMVITLLDCCSIYSFSKMRKWYFSCWLVTIEKFQVWGGFFIFHVEIFSVWKWRRWVQKKLRWLKHEKWKGQLCLEILKQNYPASCKLEYSFI